MLVHLRNRTLGAARQPSAHGWRVGPGVAGGAHEPLAGAGGAVPAGDRQLLPAILWGDFIWDDLPMIGTLAVRDPGGLRQIWLSPAEIKAEGHYWPVVYPLLVAAQAVGFRARRVPRRQRAAARGEHAAALPAHAPAEGPRGVAGGRGVRRPSRARGVRGLGDRAQGRALRGVLPVSGAGVDPLHRRAAGGALPDGAGAVRRRHAGQVGGGHAAGGAADLALVAARPRHRDRSGPRRAVLGGGSADLGGGPGFQPFARGRRPSWTTTSCCSRSWPTAISTWPASASSP